MRVCNGKAWKKQRRRGRGAAAAVNRMGFSREKCAVENCKSRSLPTPPNIHAMPGRAGKNRMTNHHGIIAGVEEGEGRDGDQEAHYEAHAAASQITVVVVGLAFSCQHHHHHHQQQQQQQQPQHSKEDREGHVCVCECLNERDRETDTHQMTMLLSVYELKPCDFRRVLQNRNRPTHPLHTSAMPV